MGDNDTRTGYSVSEVAEILDISKDAVRKRIARGTLQAEKIDGQWTIVLDDGVQGKTDEQDSDDGHFWELINDQKQEIERLKQELRQKDEWISQLIERIPPQLPAPEPETKSERIPLWKRLFGK